MSNYLELIKVLKKSYKSSLQYKSLIRLTRYLRGKKDKKKYDEDELYNNNYMKIESLYKMGNIFYK